MQGGVTMTSKELQKIKGRLLEYRPSLVRQITETKRSMRESTASELRDSGDRIWKFNTSNLWLSQNCLRSRRLQFVENALDRLERGTFGLCQDCGRAIEEKRLKAIPWAQLCLGCQKARETLEFLPLGKRHGKANHVSIA